MKLRILDAADSEVEAAFDYDDRQEPGLGFRITSEVREALEGILSAPEGHPTFARPTGEGT
jgi:hypothetical protein